MFRCAIFMDEHMSQPFYWMLYSCLHVLCPLHSLAKAQVNGIMHCEPKVKRNTEAEINMTW